MSSLGYYVIKNKSGLYLETMDRSSKKHKYTWTNSLSCAMKFTMHSSSMDALKDIYSQRGEICKREWITAT